MAPASYTVTMLGCPDKAPMAAHSRWNRSLVPASTFPDSTLIATSRPNVGCQAR